MPEERSTPRWNVWGKMARASMFRKTRPQKSRKKPARETPFRVPVVKEKRVK
jgi:hypothetical protein